MLLVENDSIFIPTLYQLGRGVQLMRKNLVTSIVSEKLNLCFLNDKFG